MGIVDIWQALSVAVGLLYSDSSLPRLGPLLLGSTFNVFLLGFVLMEGRRYYRSANK